jgi:hypothetical protein
VPGPSLGIFSARVGFLSARDFGLLFSRCVRGCFSCSRLLSAVHLCLACGENLSRQLFSLAIVSCCVAAHSSSAW